MSCAVTNCARAALDMLPLCGPHWRATPRLAQSIVWRTYWPGPVRGEPLTFPQRIGIAVATTAIAFKEAA